MTPSYIIRLGARKSELSIAQSSIIKQRILLYFPGLEINNHYIDHRDSKQSLSQDKMRFTKHIDQALIDDNIDLAVHSMKDTCPNIDNDIIIDAIMPRGHVGDAMMSLKHKSIDLLPKGALIGTSSIRRTSFIRSYRNDLILKPLKGNVTTRIARLMKGDFDAIILAKSGLDRLNLTDNIYDISDNILLPCVGQGALGVAVLKSKQDDFRQIMQKINCDISSLEVKCEQSLLKTLNASCHCPIGGLATINNDMITLKYAIIDPISLKQIRGQISGPMNLAVDIGQEAGTKILSEITADSHHFQHLIAEMNYNI